MNTKKYKIVAVSGGYDPIHIGHIRQMKVAKELGEKLIVILNTDEFLIKKKGYFFMPFHQRKEIIESIKYVDEVFESVDKDQTVTNSLAIIKPDVFAKGGDRNYNNIPKKEQEICDLFGIKVIENVGGEKVQSSSWLIDKINKIYD